MGTLFGLSSASVLTGSLEIVKPGPAGISGVPALETDFKIPKTFFSPDRSDPFFGTYECDSTFIAQPVVAADAASAFLVEKGGLPSCIVKPAATSVGPVPAAGYMLKRLEMAMWDFYFLASPRSTKLLGRWRQWRGHGLCD